MGAGASANVLPESELDIYTSLMKKWDELFESNADLRSCRIVRPGTSMDYLIFWV